MTHNPRDLEWQRRYEAGDMPWDKGVPAPALVKFLREDRLAGRVLVPGCGQGHDVRAIGAQADLSVIGLDLAPAAIARAKDLALNQGAGPHVNFVTVNFFYLPKELRRSFDWVVEHTCFCALEPGQRNDYVEAAAAALRTEGKVFAIFYLTPDVEAGPPFGITKDELSALFDPHFALLEEWMPAETFPGREGREVVRVLQKL